MAKRKDPFGKSNAVFDILVNHLYKQVNTNKVKWLIDASDIARILPLLTKWNTRWNKSKVRKTSTMEDRKATVLARRRLTKYLRPFVQKWIYYNPAMTEADIIVCGFEPHIKTRHLIPKHSAEPNMEYKVSGTHVIEAFFRQQPGANGVSRRGKPDDVYNVLIAYFIGNNSPVSPDDFTKSIMSKRSPAKISFHPSDAGKKVSFSACWMTKRGLQGNWGIVKTMIIP